MRFNFFKSEIKMKSTVYFLKCSIIIALNFLFIFCSKHTDEHTTECTTYENKVILKPISDKKFTLDSSTSAERISTIFYQDKYNGKEYIYLLNLLDNSIQNYDWETGKQINKIKLQKEGPDGVGVATNIHIISSDSIYVLAGANFKLSLINKNGKVIHQYSLVPSQTNKSGHVQVVPIGNHANPIGIIGDEIFIGGYPMIDRNSKQFYNEGKIGIKINLKNEDINYITNVPKTYANIYDQGNWLVSQQILTSQTYNRKKRTILLSFQTEPELYEVNLDNKVINKHCSNSNMFDKIEFKKRKEINALEEINYYTKQPNYSEVSYDPFRDRYLRFAYRPNANKQNNFDGVSWWKVSVISLDSDFKILGETSLDEAYRAGECFFKKDGLYIRKYTNSENSITYTRFKS